MREYLRPECIYMDQKLWKWNNNNNERDTCPPMTLYQFDAFIRNQDAATAADISKYSIHL